MTKVKAPASAKTKKSAGKAGTAAKKAKVARAKPAAAPAASVGAAAEDALEASRGVDVARVPVEAGAHGAQQAAARAQADAVPTSPRGKSKARLAAEAAKAAQPKPGHVAIVNPLSWDSSPDPTVLKVGEDVYVATTETGYKPGQGAYPLMKFPRGDFGAPVPTGKLFPPGREPAWLAADPWAPDFFHDDELGYVVTFTGRQKDGRLAVGIAYSDGPEGPYVEKVPGPFLVSDEIGLIDSHIFRDPDTGERWFLWKEDWNDKPQAGRRTPMLLRRLVVENGTTKLSGETIRAIENDLPWERNLVEGATVLKKDGKFYMFYSGGPYYNGDYVTGVARADQMTGPWEKLDLGRSIIPNDDRWEGCGHGFPMTDDHGNDYYVCHGYPAGDYKKRVLLMFPVTWENGWPVVDTKAAGVRPVDPPKQAAE